MDQAQLQQKIVEYFQRLPKEAQEVFSSMGWMETLKKIGVTYSLNEKQLELLGTETTIVLLGIIHIDEYEKIIETELGVSEEILKKITKEIDNNILKTIKGQLIDAFKSNILYLQEQNLDPNFSMLPKNIQLAIENSDWKEKLYKIARRYALTIPQMGDLEEITKKVIKNEIPADKYMDALVAKIPISSIDISNITNAVNIEVLSPIRELMKNTPTNSQVNIESRSLEINMDEEIPIPPYAKTITNDKLLINNEEKVPESYKPIEIPIENISEPKEEPKNIIEEKLKGATISKHDVTDYSTPKINTAGTEKPLPRSFDPYREQF
ncbi:MAG TPA: hypothetical protein VK153_03500 [Candidatus Paceibacterota bacterium]|nr:hypothetical protein [Candidatus Paceibacterota bacterium]